MNVAEKPYRDCAGGDDRAVEIKVFQQPPVLRLDGRLGFGAAQAGCDGKAFGGGHIRMLVSCAGHIDY